MARGLFRSRIETPVLPEYTISSMAKVRFSTSRVTMFLPCYISKKVEGGMPFTGIWITWD
jgi:hypothetical protein